MKILILTPVYEPYFELGGPAKSIKKIVLALIKKGHEVTVLTQEHYPCNYSDFSIYLKANFIDRALNKLLNFTINQYIVSNFIFLIKNVRSYDAIYLNCGFYFNNSVAGILGKILRKKILFSPRGSYSIARANNKKILKKILYLFDYIFWMHNSVVILLSDKERLDYVHNKKNINIIPNIYENNIQFVKRENILKKIIFLGRPEENKGWDIFCNIANKYSDKYHFVAIISYEKNIKANFNEIYINPPQEKISMKLIESDYIFMFSDGEGMSMSILEACYYKVIPIVNNNSVFSEIMEGCILVNNLDEIEDCFENLHSVNVCQISRAHIHKSILEYCSSISVSNKFERLLNDGLLR